MANSPNSMILPQSIRRAAALATAAKTTYADGANAVLLCAGGTNGSIVRRLQAIPLGSTTVATQLILMGYDGTNYRLLNTSLLNIFTMSANTIDPPIDFGYADNYTLFLPSTWSLYVGIGVALSAGILFNVELGDF